MSNRIAQHLPMANRIAQVFAPAGGFSCASFVMLAPGVMFVPGQGNATSVYEIAARAAQASIAAKHRYLACNNLTYRWN